MTTPRFGPALDPNGYTFDPAALARAVNALVALDHAAALRQLRDEEASGTPAERILLTARVAFDPPPGGGPLPRLDLGAPDIEPGPADAGFDRFPMALAGDLPFLLVGGYILGGEVAASPYLAWCQANATLRAPLRPVADPLAAVDQLLASDAWRGLGAPASHGTMLRAQALRAVGDADLVEGELLAAARDDWDHLRRDLPALAWDPQAGRYRATGAG